MDSTRSHSLPDEERRLEALRAYSILETPPEEALDDLTALAAQICETPVALVSLVGGDRVWFKSRVGYKGGEVPRSQSICAHAMFGGELFVVPDIREDSRFADYPLANGDPAVRFYAGAPLVTPGGAALGTLCVLDYVARELTPMQAHALEVLGRQVMTQLELRRQGRELRASEGKLRAIFEAEPECVKLLGADATLHDVNAAGLRLIEAENFQAVAGLCLLPLVVAEDREAVSSMLAAVSRGEKRTVQYRIVGLRGTPRWIEMNGVPFHDESNGGDFVLGVSHDITERKLAEEKIQRLNRLYAVSSSVNEAIVRIQDTQQLYEQACRIAVKMGGLVLAWVGLADSDDEVLRPVARWGRDEGYLDAIQVRISPGVLEGQGPGGEAFRRGEPALCNDIAAAGNFASQTEALRRGYRSCAVFPLKLEGNPVGVLSVYGDQAGYFDTEEMGLLNALAENISFAVETLHKELLHQQSEEAGRLSESRYRTLFDQAPDGIVIADTASYYLDANASICRMLGYSREEMIGLHASDIVSLREVDFIGPALHAIRNTAIYKREWEFRRKDGSVFPAEVIATLMSDGNLLGMIRDISERRKLEQQFLRAQRMESIGTLAGGIAHDLNNILSPILMSLELLKQKFTDSSSQEFLAIIGTSAQRGADMVRQVLSFARGVDGRRVEVRVSHLIEEVGRIANDTFLKHISVQTRVPANLWAVAGDPTQLHQVLLNLCVNSRDAMPGGGTLTLSAANLVFDYQYVAMNPEATPGPHVLLQVADTGGGVSSSIREMIFDPFFTTKEIGVGTGLGLSTSLAIVRSHGGFIRFESTPGEGTTFSVYLPAWNETSASAACPLSPELPRGRGELILVVDDEISVREITRQTLEAFNYRVELAADGVEAAAAFARGHAGIAAVLIDMMMPVMDGPATIQVLRRIDSEVRVIAVSGLFSRDHIAAVAKIDVNHILPKPFTAETLLRALDDLLA